MDKPSLPKGTRDFGPAVMSKRQFILDHIRSVFRNYGFMPLETPAMENLSTLTGKYGEEGDQLLFRILNSGDILKEVPDEILSSRNSKAVASNISEKGLRYDLTVPFARFVVMNRHEISLPFKRYQIQPVWRADRPQKGRYREFFQCDADVVGTDSLICEAEIILMIRQSFDALGIRDYSIKINHRGVLSGLAEIAGVKDNEASLFVAIDKLDKIGEEGVRKELLGRGFSEESISTVFRILSHPTPLRSAGQAPYRGSNSDILDSISSELNNTLAGARGVKDLTEVLSLLSSYGADDSHVEFDVALARGLSYYTGCIFEVKINNVAIGSVSGGGRYDNLVEAFGSKEKLSGVGISFGIDRIYDAMEELGVFPKEAQISSKALVCHFDEACMKYGLSILHQLRSAGIASEIYPDVTKKIQKQLEYADKKMIPYTVMIGSEEMKSQLLTLKNMRTGEQSKVDIDDLARLLKGN